MSCLILGDSIAVGLSWFVKGCAVVAKVGMSSAWILANAPGGNFDKVYISAGSNDPGNPALLSNLRAIRAKYSESHVVWIRPANGAGKFTLQAATSGDRIVYFTPGPDHVHPQSYAQLAREAQ
jgi:hypothetical protein